MLLLAFDTAGPNCAVAVARPNSTGGPRIVFRTEDRIGRGHAERLPLMVDAALAEARASYADLDRIAVTTGPGSFTGLRVGIAFARGLALALDVPAIGVGSLDALAFPFRESSTATVAAVLDAKRREVYALVRDMVSGETLVDSEALEVGHLSRLLSDARRPLVLTGAGARLVAEALDEPGVAVAGDADAPDIADVVALAFESEDRGLPLPLYGRPADAKPQLDKAVARL